MPVPQQHPFPPDLQLLAMRLAHGGEQVAGISVVSLFGAALGAPHGIA
jgi:hypothetical protein